MNFSVSCQKASLYMGDLHPDVTEDMLYHKFSPAGTILSVRVCRDRLTKRSLRYGYVDFKQPADAKRALDTLNFEELKGRPVRIMWSQRDPSIRKSGVGNMYVNNLEKSIDSRALLDTFSAFGNIFSCKVACDEHGSKGYGFVHHETQEAADRAIQRLNGMLFNDRLVFVGRFKSRQEREVELKQEKQDRVIHHKGINLYIKNLDDQIDDQRLRNAFSSFGNVLSAKVMMHGGLSRGFGFVSLSSPEEATKALTKMNGRIMATKPLYVAPAQSRTQRQTYLTNRYMQREASVGTVSYRPAPPSGDFMAAVPEAENRAGYHPDTQLAQLRPGPRQATQGVCPQDVQNIPDAMPPSALRPKTFTTMTPNSQVTHMMSTQRVSTQTRDPAPTSHEAPVLGASQPKRGTAVHKPQQHMDATPKMATSVPQPAVHMQSQEPLTDSMLPTAPPQVQQVMMDERVLVQVQVIPPSLPPKLTEMQMKQEKQDRVIHHKGINLYIKNLDDQIDDQRLRNAFSSFGNVLSAKVMMHGGLSRGFGFVSLSSPEEATKALTEMNGRIMATKPLYVAPAQSRTQRQTYLTNRYMQREASIGTVSYRPAPPSGDFMAAVPEAQNRAGYHPDTQLAQLRPGPRQATQGVCPQHVQNIPDSMPPSALSPKTFNTMTPNSQVTHMMSTQRVSTQTRDPAPTSNEAPVLGASQPKWGTAVHKPQQHMDATPKLATSVPQPAVHMQSQEPLTDSMLPTAPPQVQQVMMDERVLVQVQVMPPSLPPKLTEMLMEIK